MTKNYSKKKFIVEAFLQGFRNDVEIKNIRYLSISIGGGIIRSMGIFTS